MTKRIATAAWEANLCYKSQRQLMVPVVSPGETIKVNVAEGAHLVICYRPPGNFRYTAD